LPRDPPGIHTRTTFDAVQSKVANLTSASQIVLKSEWRRVKTGELFYRWVFRAVIIGTVILIILFMTWTRKGDKMRHRSPLDLLHA
jgi:hypothetical protein